MSVNIESFKNKYPGIFGDSEGIDYCGKSTIAPRIFQWSNATLDNKVNIVSTFEPTKDSRFGKRAREIYSNAELFGRTEPLHLQEYFALDGRVHLQTKIVPALERGEVVFSDRWRLSSVAYGASRGNEAEMDILLEMNINKCGRYFVWPDVVFLFDLDVETALGRGRSSGRSFDEFEKKEFLEGVRENYLILASRYPNIHVIDASRSVEEIFVSVRKVLEELFRNRGFIK